MKPDKVSVLIKRGALECEKISNPALQGYDITMAQFKILKYLYQNHSDSVRLMDLEAFFSLTHPTAIGIVRNLEKKGFVIRVQDSKHSRIRYLCLTEKALALKEELIGIGDMIEAEFTKNLTENERRKLIKLLRKMQGIETD